MKKYPFILIFDIDHTVIGDVTPLTNEDSILKYFKSLETNS